MKKIEYDLLPAGIIVGNLSLTQAAETKDHAGKLNVRMISKEEAQKLVTTEDSFTSGWSAFDIDSRLQKKGGTKEELIERMESEALDWTEQEQEKINKAVKTINEEIIRQQFHIAFPNEILLIKSTMQSEGGAGGYTRNNWIVLCDKVLQASENEIKNLLAHEIFHVLTRNNQMFKKQMYQTIGFTVTDEEMEFPTDLKEIRISNPDANRYDSYATFTINGKKMNCAMILYAHAPYTDGAFYKYIKIGFIPLNEQLKPIQQAGKTKIYGIDEVTDFFDQVGKNTKYNIHPEEILAENFKFAITNQPDLPTPALKAKIQELLKQTSK